MEITHVAQNFVIFLVFYQICNTFVHVGITGECKGLWKPWSWYLVCRNTKHTVACNNILLNISIQCHTHVCSFSAPPPLQVTFTLYFYLSLLNRIDTTPIKTVNLFCAIVVLQNHENGSILRSYYEYRM